MLDTLRAWLNGSRNYTTGVALYKVLGSDPDLLAVLQKGSNDFRVRRLQEELLTICNKLKENDSNTNRIANSTPGNNDRRINKNMPQTKPSEQSNGGEQQTPEQDKRSAPVNTELYIACKLEADHAYKKVMNDRAVLFSLAKEEDFSDPNMPDKVQAREKLAIEVVTGFQKVSELYDRANYVKQHGRLPDAEDENESEYDNIPDSLVKQQLDNARKAFNKLKAKEPTPVRIVLMQKHETNIKKLEEKWRSLKPVN